MTATHDAQSFTDCEPFRNIFSFIGLFWKRDLWHGNSWCASWMTQWMTAIHWHWRLGVCVYEFAIGCVCVCVLGVCVDVMTAILTVNRSHSLIHCWCTGDSWCAVIHWLRAIQECHLFYRALLEKRPATRQLTMRITRSHSLTASHSGIFKYRYRNSPLAVSEWVRVMHCSDLLSVLQCVAVICSVLQWFIVMCVNVSYV